MNKNLKLHTKNDKNTNFIQIKKKREPGQDLQDAL